MIERNRMENPPPDNSGPPQGPTNPDGGSVQHFHQERDSLVVTDSQDQVTRIPMMRGGADHSFLVKLRRAFGPQGTGGAGGDGGGGPGGGGHGPDQEPQPDGVPEWWKLGQAEWEHWEWVDFESNTLFKPLVTMMAINGMLSFGTNLPPNEREKLTVEFDQAAREWKDAAAGDKLYKVGKEVSDKEGELREYERKAVDSVKRPETQSPAETIERAERLQEYLSELALLEVQEEDWEPRIYEMREDENGNEFRGEEKAKPDFWTGVEWDKELRKFQELKDKIRTIREQIINRTSQEFIDVRDNIVREIKVARKDGDKIKKEKERNDRLEREMGELEIQIEEALRVEDIRFTEEERNAPLPGTLREVVAIFQNLERQEATDPDTPDFNREVYERSRIDLERYFLTARDMGFFRDIEGVLEYNFADMAKRVLTAGTLTGDVLDRLTREPVIMADILERDESWEFYIRRGVKPSDIANFRMAGRPNQPNDGIRGLFVRRAYGQMHQSLSNLANNLELAKARKEREDLQAQINTLHTQGESVSKIARADRKLRGIDATIISLENETKIDIKRIAGEWDVRELEREYLDLFNRQNIVGVELLYAENELEIVLRNRTTGIELKNRHEIQIAVDQFVYDVLNGTGAYDVTRVIGRMERMKTAIGRMTTVIQSAESVFLEEATKILNQIRWSAENQVWIHIRNYLQERLMMQEEANAAKQWGKENDKLPVLLTQQNGLGGLEMYELLDPRANLFFNPLGFRGQFATDKDSQYFFLETIKELHIQKLMMYEFAGDDLQELTNCKSFDEFRLKFRKRENVQLGLKKVEDEALGEYKTVDGILEQWERDPKSVSRDLLKGALENLRRTREDLTRARTAHTIVRQQAKSAFEFAVKTYDVLGISTELGDTLEIMANGDYIKTEHFVMALKYAIIEAGKSDKFKSKYYCEDNLSLLRRRGASWVDGYGELEAVYRMWTEDLNKNELASLKEQGDQWAKEMLDWINQVEKAAGRPDAYYNFISKAANALPDISQIGLRLAKKQRDGKVKSDQELTYFQLQEGFEDLGITWEQWDAVEQAYESLQINGFSATIEGQSFQDIIRMDQLKPISNNFLFAYAGVRDAINNPRSINEAARGKQPWLRKLRAKLALSGKDEFTGVNCVQSKDDQGVANVYTDAGADNTSFDIDVRKIANFLSTREREVIRDSSGRVTDVSIKKKNPNKDASTVKNTEYTSQYREFGFPAQSWLGKRVRRLKTFYDVNERFVGRFIEFNNFLFTINQGSTPSEHGADNIFEMIWNREYGYRDEYTLEKEADRLLDIWFFNSAFAGDFDAQRARKSHGFTDRPFEASDMYTGINASNFVVHLDIADLMKGSLSSLNTDPRALNAYVQNLIERDERFTPLVFAIVKRLEVDSGGAGFGIGYEQANKLNYRWMKTVLSRGEAGSRRLEGGLRAYANIAEYLAYSALPNSFGDGTSLMGTKWSKERAARNAVTGETLIPTPLPRGAVLVKAA